MANSKTENNYKLIIIVWKKCNKKLFVEVMSKIIKN